MCPNLTSPENGPVVEAVDGNVTGTVANYSCDADYLLVGSLIPRPNQPPARIAFSIARGDTESDPHWGWLGLGTRLISWECEQMVCC